MINLLKMSYSTSTNFLPPSPPICVLRPYQCAGVEYAISTKSNRTIIADEPGLGKTPTAIALMNAKQVDKYLVICPASLVQNWYREISKWTLSRFSPHIFRTSGKNPANSILILSYGLCSTQNALTRILENYRFDGLIVDESHMIAHGSAARTRNILGINGPFDRADVVACLSGTPIVNQPIDIWPLVNRLRPDVLGCKSYREFGERFANAKHNPFTGRIDYVGSKNEEELGRILRSNLMVRREKSEVLKDLPAKTRRVIYLDANPEAQRLVKTEAAMYDKFLADEKISIDQTNSMLRVRVRLAILKAAAAISYCQMALQEEKKILVFGWHRELLTRLVMALAPHNPVVLSGATPSTKRQARVDKFQNDPSCRVFVGAIPAAGVGLTLTASSRVIMAESSWIPSENIQAEDRSHRYSQVNAVLVDYLVFPNSVDERVLKEVGKKAVKSNLILNS